MFDGIEHAVMLQSGRQNLFDDYKDGTIGTDSEGVDQEIQAVDPAGNFRRVGYLDTTLTPEGGLFGGFIDVLQRLANGPLLLSTARHAEQLGHVLQGTRLSDDEIEALPKVHFERAEEQSCAICLEAYEPGMLLTRLSCNHFFHPVCLAKWMRRATRCPLCRANYAGEYPPDSIAE